MDEPKNLKITENEKSGQKSSKVSIDKVISLQNIDGSWTEQSLIKQIAGNAEKVMEVMKQVKPEIVLTYLITNWIRKHYPEKQYALIVKKGQLWLKKALQKAMLEEGKLSELNACI